MTARPFAQRSMRLFREHVTVFPARFLTALIRFYQNAVSPYLGARCRFYPSCSHYAILAIRKDGALKGSAKAVWRILRCNPFSPGGIDHP